MELRCPECGSSDLTYRKKRDAYICEDCDYEWSEEKDRAHSPEPEAPLGIFLSYGHDRNEELVLRIKSDLEKRGHRVWIDRSEIKSGDDWRRAITGGIIESERFISFLSRHSTRDPGICLDEIGIAIGVKGGDIQTILVESEKEVCPPATVSHIQWLDMHDWKDRLDAGNEVWDAWYQDKFSEIVRVVESVQGRRFAGEIEQLKEYLLPVSSDSRIQQLISKGFVGREWMKEDLEEWLDNPDRQSRLYWITGEPGAGKSAFAAHLSHYGRGKVAASQFIQWDKPDHRDPGRVVRSIAFQLAARLPDYRKLLLTLPEIKKLDGKNASELFDYLLATPLNQTIGGGRENYLVVLDALDEAGEGRVNKLAEMLAGNVERLPGCISFVVTSRPESSVIGPLQRYAPYEMKLRKDENLKDMEKYLRRALPAGLGMKGESEWGRIIDEILQRSEGVFLYAACVCEEVKEGRLSLDRLEEFPQGLGGVYAQYFARHFPDKDKYRKTIRPMLQIVLAARDSFPLELLRKRFKLDRSGLKDLLRDISSYFTVKEKNGEECLSVYHKTLSDWLTDETRAQDYYIALDDGHDELSDWGMELYCEGGVNNLPEYFLLHLPGHLIEAGREKEAADFLADLAVFRKMFSKGAIYPLREYWSRLGDRFSPAGYYRVSLSKMPSEDSFELVAICTDLGLFFKDILAEYEDARVFLERALSICESTVGPDHPDTAASLNSLAALYRAYGDYASARHLYERALSIRERMLGSDHPDTAESLNDLAGLYVVDGDYALARPLYERVILFRERMLGPDHPDTAASLNSLAGLFFEEGDFVSARPLYERALSIRERILGPDHPDTATSLNSLAGLCRDVGDFAMARALYERALSIREGVFGPDHPSTSTSLNSLAKLYHEEGDFASARPLYERALSIRVRTLGPDHPKIAASLNNLAKLCYAEGDYASARPLNERALSIFERTVGPNHPETADSLNSLAELFVAEGDYSSARPLCERALSIRGKTLGPDHPKTAASLNSLAKLYHEEGDNASARPLYERALSICLRTLVPDHPLTRGIIRKLNEIGGR